jgi:ribosome-binding ATPase
MRICFVGPPQSGKSTLFSAVVEAGGSSVDISRGDQAHLGVVKVPDERLIWLSELFNPKKTTPAELELLDLPGFDLSGEAGRSRSKTHWTAMRQSDCLVLVVRDFGDDSVAQYRNRIDAQADVRELLSELLFADLEQVTARVEKLEVSVKKPTPKRDEQLRELELMKRLLDALENEKLLNEVIASESDAKLVSSFGFLSQKPVLVVYNSQEDKIASVPDTIEDVPVLGLCAQIEEEIAQLEPSERGEFLAEMNLDASASDRLIRACYDRMNLVSFLTTGEDECRAWTIPANTPAVEAAGKIHSDIARGFIRAETVAYDDFHSAGDMKQAKAAGTIRLEGKTYLVQDGDMINFRFNV